MRTTIVPCPNAIVGGGVFDPGPGAPAGTWDDDSDATSSLGDSATELPKVRTVTRNQTLATVTAHVRYTGDAPEVSVAEFANGNFSILTQIQMPGGTVGTPTWTSVQMSGDIDQFLRSLYSDVSLSGFLVLLGNDANRYYEAHLTVVGPGGNPHPLRHYPRDDNLAGHARRYPSTTFQRTRRRAGGYR